MGGVVYFVYSPGSFRHSSVEELDDPSKGVLNVVFPAK